MGKDLKYNKDEINVKKENYGKFIFKGSLAIECYNDIDNTYEELYKSYNKKLSEFYSKKKEERSAEYVEYIANELKKVITAMGVNNFDIYDDGDVACNL